ncbi:MAG: signal peptidase I [Candidatus Pacebacteria bacterium]|nr:signal peptidase I [Candidatus Paceibacterota bacterium]
MNKFPRNLISFLQTFLLALAIVIPVRYFLFQPFIVSGSSMEPNFKQGEYLLIDELSFRFRAPERGEVVVFRYPKNPSYFYIKRIIGLPGETVEIQNSKLKIYNYNFPEGKVFNEPYIKGSTEDDLKITLDKNEYFVLGDNREHSSDSRVFGPVSKKNIIGRGWIAVYPSQGVEILKGAVYK